MSNIERIEKMDLVTVDAQRINTAIRIYFHWKQLDAEIRTFSGTRGINFPSELSECLVCYALNFKLNKASGGDAVDFNVLPPKIIEIKASSTDDAKADLSSFSPDEDFDELIFARLEKHDDLLKIYRLGMSSTDLKTVRVSKSQTFGDQQRQGRRPRFSIQKTFITPRSIEPDVILDIRNKKIIKR